MAKKKIEIVNPVEAEDPFNHINTALVKKGKIVKFSVQEIPWQAFSNEQFDKKEFEENGEKLHQEKLHPVLKKWISERSEEEKDLIMINFRDDLKLPRFPEPIAEESRKSSANKKALKRSETLIREIIDRRANNYKKLIQEIGDGYDCRVLETFWLINAILAEIPIGKVSELAQREDVLYIEPQNAGEEPPSNPNPSDDVDDGRSRIVTDPYFNLRLTSGWIGLLDTGLRFTHRQFNSPSNIAYRRDCVNGGANCNSGTRLNPNDDCWNHGTSSAAIITGNTNQGNAFRGVTGITLDSFKVYPSSFSGGICTGRSTLCDIKRELLCYRIDNSFL
jgi:serine protease AprX